MTAVSRRGSFRSSDECLPPAARAGGGGGAHFLLPTAETALINLHRDEILEEGLPGKFFAYTPCYRKEAGSYRTAERGMVRGHQFNKVEMFQFTRPEDSAQALEELIHKAEALVQGLGLHHRVRNWRPGLLGVDGQDLRPRGLDTEHGRIQRGRSASNAGDYQARRGQIRFRRKGAKKPELLHT